MDPFIIKQGDTKYGMKVQLVKDDGITFVDLTDCSVQFRMSNGVDELAEIVTATDGIVQYIFQENDTQKPGAYISEFKVTFPDFKTERFPTEGYIPVVVLEEV